MRTGLYVYWGALGDHSRNVPGHPLYQVFAMDTLAELFQLDQLHFVSLYTDKVETSCNDVEFYIQHEKRSLILQRLNVKIISFTEALKHIDAYEAVFLKARFRNKSRLEEKSYDALKFEKLYAVSDPESTYIIDSDGELPLNFFDNRPSHLLTYFRDHDFYTAYTSSPLSIQTISPALTRHFSTSVRTIPEIDLMFIGNEGLKDPTLGSWLHQLHEDHFKVCVQGKWNARYPFEILPRTARQQAYKNFENSLATLQLSKAKYQQYDFLSPRIYEAHICGLPVFTLPGSSASTTFLQVESYRELAEKLRCLRDGFARDYKVVIGEQKNKLAQLETTLYKNFTASPS